jgi:hypothetical protein
MIVASLQLTVEQDFMTSSIIAFLCPKKVLTVRFGTKMAVPLKSDADHVAAISREKFFVFH